MKNPGKSDWNKLQTMSDNEIDYTDVESTDAKFWGESQIVEAHSKVKLSLQIDDDIANWINQLGKNSDTTVNGILRSYFNTIKLLQKAS